MFLKSDCCRMNFEKPHYGLENWESFLQQMFYPFSTHAHRIVLNEKSLDEFFCHTIPHMGKSGKSQMTNGHLKKCFCHTIPQVGGGGSTLSSHPIPTLLVVPFLGKNYEWLRWYYLEHFVIKLQNAPEIFGKSGSLVIWMIVFFLVRKIDQIWQNQRYPKDI